MEAQGEAPVLGPLRLGNLTIASPVVLAPMAGVTNLAYRQLCREHGAGLYVCEMITSRGITERISKTFDMVKFAPDEEIRSVQLYGVDASVMGEAVRILGGEFGVQHVDLNFGCPVPKVTRKGGGGALPWKRDRLAAIVAEAVNAAADYAIPVTIKTRIGIDDDHVTYLDTGRIAEDVGCSGITLHGRTVAQAYSGTARWDAIAALVSHVSIPVLGNGDIWEAADAISMVEQTGCAGVVIGRGCLGRPWLFADLANAFAGRPDTSLPTLGEVAAIVRRHGELLAGLFGEERGLVDLRKHMAWYFKGFRVGGEIRRGLAMVSSFVELDRLLGELDHAEPFPRQELGAPRGRQGSPRGRVVLPHRWLESRELDACDDLREAELDVSGG